MIKLQTIVFTNSDKSEASISMFDAKPKHDIKDKSGRIAYKKGEEIGLYYQKFTPFMKNGKKVHDKRIQIFKRFHLLSEKEWRGNTHRVYESDDEIEKDFECI